MCRGIPVLFLVAAVVVSGCEKTILGPELPNTKAAIFDEVWKTVERHYAAFVVKEVDWSTVYESHRPGLDAVSEGQDFFDLLCEMLEELEDGHVSLTAPHGTCTYPGLFTPAHYFNLALIRWNYVPNARTTARSSLTYGRIAEDIGYIHIRSFKPGDRAWSGDMDDVLSALGPIKWLVLDVRDNGGGSLGLATAVAGRFADRERVFAYVSYRDGPRYTDLTDPKPMKVVPTGEQRFTGQIAVLTNRHCFSACEGFVLAMDELPHVVTVGDTTGGGFGNPLVRELSNGWTYRVPVWLMSTANGAYLEGIGIAPDVPAVISLADLERAVDTILETGLGQFKAKREFQSVGYSGQPGRMKK